MSFWKTYKAEREERREIIPARELVDKVVRIVGVRSVETRYGARWAVDIDEPRVGTLLFPQGSPGRDHLLYALLEYFEENTDPVKAKIVMRETKNAKIFYTLTEA